MTIRRLRGCRGGVLAGYPQAVHRGGVGGDVLDGEVGLVGIDREQRGHVGDGGVVAAGEVLRCVGDRWRERAAEGVDELAAGVPGKVECGVGWLGCGVHGGDMVLVQISVNVRTVGASLWRLGSAIVVREQLQRVGITAQSY
jgi:hypothetical protein